MFRTKWATRIAGLGFAASTIWLVSVEPVRFYLLPVPILLAVYAFTARFSVSDDRIEHRSFPGLRKRTVELVSLREVEVFWAWPPPPRRAISVRDDKRAVSISLLFWPRAGISVLARTLLEQRSVQPHAFTPHVVERLSKLVREPHRSVADG